MMDIRRAAALLLALVMIAALTVGCGKKQSDTPTDTPAAGADGRTPAQQPAKLVCYNGSVTLRFVREEDTWYWGDDRDFPLEQSIVTELLATVQGYAALSPLPHTDDLSQFGLSDTKRYISLTDTEGNTRTYWLGTQTDEGQYIQPEGETDAVYLSPAGVDGTLSMGIYDMARLPKLPQLTADNVSAQALHEPEQPPPMKFRPMTPVTVFLGMSMPLGRRETPICSAWTAWAMLAIWPAGQSPVPGFMIQAAL